MKHQITVIILVSLLGINTPENLIRTINSTSDLMYVERYDKLNFITHKWNLIIYMELDDYFELYRGTQKILEKAKNACLLILEISQENSCKMFIQELNSTLSNIYSRNYIFSELDTSLNKKIKRDAPIKFIGQLSKTLFGTLDEDDGKVISEQINLLQDNQNNLMNISKHQRIILESTLTLLNSTLTKSQTKYKEMDDNLGRIIFYIEQINNDNNKNFNFSRIALRLENTIVHVIFLLNHLELIQNQLIEIITFSRHGILHPLIINLNTFGEELKNIQSSLDKGLSLPFKLNQLNNLDLYDMLKPVSYYVGKRLIFSLDIPIILSKDFELFKLTSTFRRNKNSDLVTFILPRENFLVKDTVNQLFLFVSDNEIKESIKIKKHNTLCHIKRPLNKLNEMSNGICELQLFFENQLREESCDVRIMKLKYPIWNKLLKKNSWLVYSPTRLTISFICNEIKHEEILEPFRTTLVELDHRCQLHTFNEIILNNDDALHSERVLRYELPFNEMSLSDIAPLEPSLPNFQIQTTLVTYNNEQETLKELSHGLEQIKEKEGQLRNNRNFKITVTTMSASGGIILIIVIIFLIMLITKLRKQGTLARSLEKVSTRSSPMPREFE